MNIIQTNGKKILNCSTCTNHTFYIGCTSLKLYRSIFQKHFSIFIESSIHISTIEYWFHRIQQFLFSIENSYTRRTTHLMCGKS